MKKTISRFLFCLLLGSGLGLSGQEQREMVNLMSLQEGTMPVIVPANYGGWPAEALLDDKSRLGLGLRERKDSQQCFCV